MKTPIKLFILCTFLLLIVIQVGSDDKELFMGMDLSNLDKVKPNVVILMDSSGSMNSIITYPRNPQDINLVYTYNTLNNTFIRKEAWGYTCSGVVYSVCYYILYSHYLHNHCF